MRAVIQRVSHAGVVVAGESRGQSNGGCWFYSVLGLMTRLPTSPISRKDRRAADLRGRRGQDEPFVEDVGGAVLVVSQFTLFGDVRRGRRPNFSEAAHPALAEALYEDYVEQLRRRGLKSKPASSKP